LDRGRRFQPPAMASQGIHITAIQKSILKQLGQPPQTLGPNQWNIFVGQTDLTAGVLSFRLDALCWNIVELRQKTDVTASFVEFFQATSIFRGTIAVAPIVGIQQKVSEKTNPFTLYMLVSLMLSDILFHTAMCTHHPS